MYFTEIDFWEIGLKSEKSGDRIFEIVAIRAFTATKFLLEIQQNPDVQQKITIYLEQELHTTSSN